jgi:hypothetical protein
MNLLGTFGPLLRQIAPTIATALGGPVAGMAVRALSIGLLGREDGTADDLAAVLAAATPDQVTEIKRIDSDFQIKMKQLDIDLEALVVADRKSAREMQMALRTNLVPSMAIFILCSFVAVTVATLLGYTKVDSVLAGTLIGYLSAKAEQVISFYFGSSNSSQNKDMLLYNSTPMK